MNLNSNYSTKNLSVLVFRLGNHRFALPTVCIKEVTNVKKVHSIPHRSGEILQGLVNLNGVLQLCVDMHPLLNVKKQSIAPSRDIHLLERMIAIKKEKELWVFQVEGIEGILTLQEEEIEKIHLLDVESLFQILRNCL